MQGPVLTACPELNPIENTWQFMRDNWLSNRVFRLSACTHAGLFTIGQVAMIRRTISSTRPAAASSSPASSVADQIETTEASEVGGPPELFVVACRARQSSAPSLRRIARTSSFIESLV